MHGGRIRVPVGEGSARWTTRGACHRVLLVVHNVTSATRLLDVLPLFRDDLRVQLLVTCTGSSPFQSGTADLITSLGLPVLPWEQALETPVDLAVSASFGGQQHLLPGRLVILPHGVGHNKRLPLPGSSQSAADAPVFGLSPEWLLSDGGPVADALVLSHPEQIERLRAACPQAVPTAVLGGDPAFDRILAARPFRERFRRSLDVRDGQRLILLNSTWSPESLFGNGGEADTLPWLLSQLTELPTDEYRVAAVLHPNIWHGHGTGQIKLWLDSAQRAGLTLVDPLTEWHQALIAADTVIGDAGSVSFYAAALGTPVLLAAAPLPLIDPLSPTAAFAGEALRLDPGRPLLGQLETAAAQSRRPSGPAELITSAPGESAALLRRLFYRLIGIPEPAEAARLEPLPLPPLRSAPRTEVFQVVTRLLGAGEVSVQRLANPAGEPASPGEVHTAAHEDALHPRHHNRAEVIFRSGSPDDPRFGTPEQWTAEILARHPHCELASFTSAPGRCTVRTRGSDLLALHGSTTAADPAAYASALYAWLRAGKSLDELATGGMTVWTGRTANEVSVLPVQPLSQPLVQGRQAPAVPTPLV